ncbi:MAG TPA: asparagine synthase-related protein [Bryobacteraceae bacterium]|nr:asparagine synthase-related protein [Bryobacteraceae bacterium]
MSGIVGILHLDQSPVERRTLQGLTDFLTFRGPDAQQIWVDGPVGFGHTLLKTAAESETEHQPFSLDGATWIVADARLDARPDLIAKLENQSQPGLGAAADVELLLRAYLAWGEKCVDRLLGDFAFGIWDSPRQRLFCARDHLGIKPFYYSHNGSLVIFSNTLECIRQHPAVSDQLNDLAIADFLLLQRNQDLATTMFADIQRLPPAHTSAWSRAGKQSRRYWTMPVDPPLFLRRSEEYVDRFKELLRQSVGDRLRTNEAGIFMSGGLDSTSMAAGAAEVLRARSPGGLSLWALTRDDPENPAEKQCAGLAAKALAIPIHFFNWGDASIDGNWQLSPLPTPEPALQPWELAATRNLYRQASTLSRVFLHGEGPDHGLLFEWRPYVSYLLDQGRYGRILRDLYVTVLRARGGTLSKSASTRAGQIGPSMQLLPQSFPEWVNPALESQYDLRHRWEAKWLKPPAAAALHPTRPVTYASFLDPVWPSMFDGHDAAWTGTQVEVRHPYLDLRMLRFFLAVPPMPWCKQKYLVRRAMRGVLPKSVLGRDKEAVAWATMMERTVSSSSSPFDPVPQLSVYVDTRRFPTDVPQDQWLLGCALRVRSLNNWLQYVQEKPRLQKI